MEAYERQGQVGSGTWGVVFAALHRESGKKVAIKRIKQVTQLKGKGLNYTALREIKYLQEIRHENVVTLEDVFVLDDCVHLVFEFVETDLEKLIKDRSLFLNEGVVKCLMQMVTAGVKACHDRFVLHRDLKPANLLITSGGVIKLADFGFARYHGSPERKMSHIVATTWYRPLELFFQARHYGPAIDIWAVGCIFGEIMLRTALFPGNSEMDVMKRIIQTLGTPTGDNWAHVEMLRPYQFERRNPLDLRPLFSTFSDEAFDLLSNLLRLDPGERLTATQILSHPFFTTDQHPIARPEDIPLPRVVAALTRREVPAGQIAQPSRPLKRRVGDIA